MRRKFARPRWISGAAEPADRRLDHHTFPSQGIDDMMGTLYSRIAAYTCVAPLVMTSNDPASSLTINK
jgi:hypothetical protein